MTKPLDLTAWRIESDGEEYRVTFPAVHAFWTVAQDVDPNEYAGLTVTELTAAAAYSGAVLAIAAADFGDGENVWCEPYAGGTLSISKTIPRREVEKALQRAEHVIRDTATDDGRDAADVLAEWQQVARRRQALKRRVEALANGDNVLRADLYRQLPSWDDLDAFEAGIVALEVNVRAELIQRAADAQATPATPTERGTNDGT